MDAQTNYYYYYNGSKVYLNLDKTSITLITENNFQKNTINNFSFKSFELGNEPDNFSYKYAIAEYEQIPNDATYFQKLNSLNSNNEIIKANPNFTNSNGQKIGLSHYFYVKLNSSNDFSLLQTEAINRNVVIVEQNQFMPLWYTLKITKNTIGNTLEIANQFYETGLFVSCQPDFLSDDRFCTNDPMFGSLWGLNNTSNPNIDINVCQAWNITNGENVVVAVLDQGIDKMHEDLSDNIYPLSYNTETNTSPSQLFGDHGTHCAGTIAAIKDNDLQVVGVSPSAKLMDISNSLEGTPNSRIKRADGINWAWQNGADIISNSWGSSVQYQVIDDAIDNALQNGRNGKGTIVVFATGNSYGAVSYPANSNPNILAVGAITSNGSRSNFSNYGSQLDVVAPGSGILSTIPNNDTGLKSGTSMATPHVSGVAALVLSVNPCLTAQQVRDIIERTSQKIGNYSYQETAGRPNGTWNNQMGYGLVDAYAAVQLAQQMYSSTLDLYVRDYPDDIGIEPNTITEHTWRSQDIWVRHTNDSGLVHQNPEYDPNLSNYVYVKVINKSCIASSGNDVLKVYWSKAATAMSWDSHWNGSLFPTGQKRGDFIGQVNIPIIQSGGEAIIPIEWNNIPNPDDYTNINSEPWHFCLLARIESEDDPIITETYNTGANVRNNNNIAQKNITIVDVNPNSGGKLGGVIAVGNLFNTTRNFTLNLIADNRETGKKIFEEAEVSITLDENLLAIWENGGKQGNNIVQREENRLIVTGDNASLDNLVFRENEFATLDLKFNFLTKEVTEKEIYTYHVIQKESSNNEVIGGETYEIYKNPRALFFADAGNDKQVNKNEPVTLNAETLNEPAIYNWYDEEGNLIYEGVDFTVSVEIGKKYKLEVIALADGYKDYAEVEVKLKPNTITALYPNPASSQVAVTYKINKGDSAYLSVTGFYGSNISNNYILNIEENEITLDISNYPQGLYSIVLIVNGQIQDTTTLIKQ